LDMYQIGALIKNTRIKQGISQEDLCQNICTRETLSRIENGKQDPSSFTLNGLLHRLGLPESHCQILLGVDDFAAVNLMREITELNTCGNYAPALKKISALEGLCAEMGKTSRTVVSQYILRAKALAGYYEGEEHKAYTFAEQRAMLTEALELTCPNFKLENINACLLGEEETKIINHIALTYSEDGDYSRAMEIYKKLLEYIQSRFASNNVNEAMLPLVAYNFSRLLGREGHPKYAIKVAEAGRRCCVRSNKCRMLGGLLLNLACCYHDIGEDEKSKELLKDAYFIHKVMERPRSCELIKNYAWETFQIEMG